MLIGPTEYLRIAVDPLRLAILGRAAAGPVDAEALAADLHDDPRRVRREVGRLMETGLVNTEKVISHRLPLTEIHRAIEVMSSPERNKVVIHP